MGLVRIGCDPGATGAIAIIFEENLITHDMPTLPEGGVDAGQLAAIFSGWMRYGDCRVNVERVHAMPGNGVSGMFKFGQSYGKLTGCLEAVGLPYGLVTPQSWKRQFGLIGKEKDAARLKAIEIFPKAAKAFNRKKDIGRADASLIAMYEKCQ